MGTRSISELVAEHPRVVFDTSILDATHASRETKEAYNAELEMILSLTDCYTVGSVPKEARRVLRKPENFYRQVEKHRLALGEWTELFKDIRARLIPQAKLCGPLERKSYGKGMTDVELVALTYVMACGGPIALLSGDQDLMALANWQRRHADVLGFRTGEVSLYLFSPVLARFAPLDISYGTEQEVKYGRRVG